MPRGKSAAKKDDQQATGPHDITTDLWGYTAPDGGKIELWTKHGCVGVLRLSVARRLVRLLSK